ncbi:inositol monophosphatase family protein [Luteococcus peritonei]
MITPRFRALSGDEVDEKLPGDFVTIADRESEQVLTRELPRMFPGATVVGEEATFADPRVLDRLGDEHVFLVDPVDGTRNFVKGSPDHAVMVSELRRGEPTRTWIWQPEHQQAYLAERGAGAVRIDHGVEQPMVPRQALHRLPIGATSKGARRGFTADGQLAPVQMSAWCAGIDYPRLATGQLDYLVYKNLKPWDHVPGAVLLRELGGASMVFEGRDYRPTDAGPGLVIAASRELAELVIETWQQP